MEVKEELADPESVLERQHAAKEFGFGARKGDGALHLAEPVEWASHKEVVRAAARELCFSAGVNQDVQRKRRVGRIAQVAIAGTVEVGQD